MSWFEHGVRVDLFNLSQIYHESYDLYLFIFNIFLPDRTTIYGCRTKNILLAILLFILSIIGVNTVDIALIFNELLLMSDF